MKVSGITMEGSQGCSRIQLDNLSPNLNVVFSQSRTVRSSLRHFIGTTLFGAEVSSQGGTLTNTSGSIVAAHGDRTTAHKACVTPLVNDSALPSRDRRDLSGLFNVALGAGPLRVRQFVSILRDQFGVGDNSPDPSDYQRRREQATRNRKRLALLVSELDELAQEHQRLKSELESRRRQQAERLVQVDQEMRECDLQMAQLRTKITMDQAETNGPIARSSEDSPSSGASDQDIAGAIHAESNSEQNAKQRAGDAEASGGRVDELLLRARLDEMDSQMRPWRSVLSDIQEHRVRLGQELSESQELSIESPDHPYHDARDIIQALESRVNQSEQLYEEWTRSSSASDAQAQCKILLGEMRNDLSALCVELAQQYQQLRQRAIITELRQLRRCYQSISQGAQELLTQREAVVERIRDLDAGPCVSPVVVADRDGEEENDFNEANSQLRTPLDEENASHTHDPICEASQRPADAIVDRLDEMHRELGRLQMSREALAGERAAWGPQNAALEASCRRVEVAFGNKRYAQQALAQQIEKDQALDESDADRLVARATSYLRRLSSGRWPWLTVDATNDIHVADNLGDVCHFESLAADAQDQVYLALVLAATEKLESSMVQQPLVLQEECAANLNWRAALETLHDFCITGHQVIWITGDRRVFDEAEKNGAARFDLADTSVTLPYVNPYQPLRPRGQTPIVDPLPGTSEQKTGLVHGGSELQDLDIVESIYLKGLADCGVHTVSQLLAVADAGFEEILSPRGFKRQQIQRWQNQAIWLISLPCLDNVDARMLVACGIDGPEEMLAASDQEIVTRLLGYLTTPPGRRTNVSQTRYDLTRVSHWRKRLLQEPAWRDTLKGLRSRWDSQHWHPTRLPFSLPAQTTLSATPNPQAPSQPASQKPKREQFHLHLSDPLEAAASIGPKTAERFANIDVKTVGDLLGQTPEILASKINNKRLTAKNIRTWQQQVQLQCQVPDLRGADAQLLVGCGITDPRQLADIQPQALMDRVAPFAASKEGTRLLRSQPAPDLQRLAKWIASAKHPRALQAA